MPKEVALNGAKRHDPLDPSFSVADTHLFCRALSVGVTFLCAACVNPRIIQTGLTCYLAGHRDLSITCPVAT